MLTMTNRQARQFILLKHGLLGDYKFKGKDGAHAFIRQSGCIQYDPVDICGRNADLTLQSRTQNYKKSWLDELLYKDRALADYPDKNLSIINMCDWPYFERYREAARDNVKKYPEMGVLIDKTREIIRASGPVSSDDFTLEGDFSWRSAIHWSSGSGDSGNVSRSVLEQMYSSGDLIIHHKKGTRKYYDLSEKYVPEEILRAPEPLPDEVEHQKWRIFRRIGAIGLMWNRPSFAWLYIWDLSGPARGKAFEALLGEGKIIETSVEGIRGPLYIQAGDLALAETVINGADADIYKPRCEFMAPLDPMLWDRQLIKALFNFHYQWEIYTPAVKRRFGAYVLPILYGDRFIGRLEAVRESKAGTLAVKNIWFEDGVKPTKKINAAIGRRLQKFAKFNGCAEVEYKG